MRASPKAVFDLACQLAGGVPEYRFAPPRRWRFDWAWPDLQIACEYEGGTWAAGAHVRGAHYASDCSKYNRAAALGWRVYRFTADMVSRGDHHDFIPGNAR